jgi:hypothetical protein
MKAILTGCAIAALLVGSAAAQGRGVGLGGGIGAGAGGGVGVGGGIGGIGSNAGMGVGAGINTGPSTRAPDIATGRANTATTVRGAADVLPNTRASAQGQTSGSRSSANAAADASSPASSAERRAATTDIRAGALVKSTTGGTLGRIESVTPATGGAAATVTIRSGAETWTLPQSELNASGDFLVTSRTRP